MPDQKAQNTPETNAKPHVKTIPQSFYGTKDPAINYSAGEVQNQNASQETLTSSTTQSSQASPKVPPMQQAPAAPTTPKTPPPSPAQPAGVPAKKTNIILYTGIGIVLLLVIGALIWFYLSYVQDSEPETSTPDPIQLPVVETPTTQEPTEPEPTISEPEEPEEPTVPTSTTSDELIFPRLLFVNATDLDEDELTDREEELFGTDPGIWDSDSDSYYDGQEIFNLYNPTGFAPIRLIDSGLVNEYINNTWGYRIYYPNTWEPGIVDATTNDQLLISSASGEYVEVRAFSKPQNETFQTWFARMAPDQRFTDLVPILTPSKESGFKRRDDLVAYFVQDTIVYVLLYQPGLEDIVSYRHAMQMMVNSFRFNKSTDSIMNQDSLGTTTSTTDIGMSTSSTMMEMTEQSETTTITTNTTSTTNTSTQINATSENSIPL